MRTDFEDGAEGGGASPVRGTGARASRIRGVRAGKTSRTRSTKRAVGGMHQRRNKHWSW